MAAVQFEARRTEIAGILEMIEEGWAYCDSQGEPRVIGQAYYDSLKTELVGLVAKGASTGSTTVDLGADAPRRITDRPTAGSRAANQFGEFKVKYATVKQVRYIQSLLEGRDLTALEATGSDLVNLQSLREQVLKCQINKKAASAAIDLLLRQPVKAQPASAPATPAQPSNPASEKQVALIKRLAAEKDWNTPGNDMQRMTIDSVVAGATVSKSMASLAIDYLFACAKAAVQVASELTKAHTGPWVHATTWNVYRVYFGRQSGQMLAKVWVPGLNPRTTADGVEISGDWEYAGKADRFINPDRDHKMTREEAAAWGQNSANCCVCGADLDDPISIDRGIGPVCWGKMG